MAPVYVIEANIGGGKSTCLSLLQKHSELTILQEPVEEWSLWLDLFYLNKTRWAFALQTKIMRYFVNEAHKLIASSRGPVVIERSINTSRAVFVQALADEGHMKQAELQLLDHVFPPKEFPVIHHLILVDTPPEVCLQRVAERGRSSELPSDPDTSTGITLGYLQGLRNRLEAAAQQLSEQGCQVYRIDGQQTPEEVERQVFEIVRPRGLWARLASLVSLTKFR